MSPHLPARPDWTCRTCAQPWPCEPRREMLLEEYRGDAVQLVFFMAMCMTDASMDLPAQPSGALSARFLGWLRPGVAATR